jgi:hypothetical protein
LTEASGLLSSPPPKRRQRLLLGIDLLKRVSLEEFTILHDKLDGVDVVDVVKRILIEHDEIGEFARLAGAEILSKADSFGAA